MLVNCAPARRECLPVIAPAEAIVRAGERRGAIRNAECAIRNWRTALLGRAVLLGCLAFGLRLALAFLAQCLVFDHAWRYVPVAVSCVRSRLSFFLWQEKRDGLRCVTFLFPRGSKSPLERSRMPCGYRTALVHLGIARFLQAIPTELRSRRRSRSAFLRNHIGLVAFSAGSTLGTTRPKTCAKESSTLWTLFIWVAT